MSKQNGWNEVLRCTSAFRKAMNSKLFLNQHKGNRNGWKMDDPYDLLIRVREETEELAKALDSDNKTEILQEAADIANMAMMVADAYDALHVPKK
jgi:NTP pyrophosphatase (non-canonical NTP hydrolase)